MVSSGIVADPRAGTGRGRRRPGRRTAARRWCGPAMIGSSGSRWRNRLSSRPGVQVGGSDPHCHPGAGLDDRAGVDGGDEGRLGRREVQRLGSGDDRGRGDLEVGPLSLERVDERLDHVRLLDRRVDRVRRPVGVDRQGVAAAGSHGHGGQLRQAGERGLPDPQAVHRDGRQADAHVVEHSGRARGHRGTQVVVGHCAVGLEPGDRGDPFAAGEGSGHQRGLEAAELQELQLDAGGPDGQHEPDGLGVGGHRSDDRRGKASDGGRGSVRRDGARQPCPGDDRLDRGQLSRQQHPGLGEVGPERHLRADGRGLELVHHALQLLHRALPVRCRRHRSRRRSRPWGRSRTGSAAATTRARRAASRARRACAPPWPAGGAPAR